jgi:hypothetical protein
MIDYNVPGGEEIQLRILVTYSLHSFFVTVDFFKLYFIIHLIF